MFKDFTDSQRVDHTISILEGDRNQEFIEIATALGLSQSSTDWKRSVMEFCLDFKECFTIFTDKGSDVTDSKQVDKCFRLMRNIGKGKTSMREVTYLQNIADTLAQEFKLIYNHSK